MLTQNSFFNTLSPKQGDREERTKKGFFNESIS